MTECLTQTITLRNQWFFTYLHFLTNRWQQVILDNSHSDSCRVSSGVPQGPLLFLLYINDLPNNISSTIRLYVNNAIIYRIIHLSNDIQKLQEYIIQMDETLVYAFQHTQM